MGILITIEGTDASGKQTQTQKLYERIKELNINVKKISFPNYESASSSLVKMYLNGDFGKNPNDVNAYAPSSFFSVDRYASYKTDWGKNYLKGDIIISDRYTSANMVHQISKIESNDEKMLFLDWLEDLEFNKLGLPRPNMVFFLNVPIEYTFKLMETRKNKITGNDIKDIHEKDKEYLKKSYENAIKVAKIKKWVIIDCVENDKMRSIDEINNLIFNKIKEELL